MLQLTKYTSPHCTIKRFNDELEKILVESGSYDDFRNSFLRTCMEHSNIFTALYKLSYHQNLGEVASLVPLIHLKKYNLEQCICRMFLYIWE